MTSILPREIDEFSSPDYWNNFFTQRPTSFEWYGDFTSLVEVFIQNVKKSDSILEIGCGNSTLSADIYDKIGCSSYLGIDYSQKAIEQSRKLVDSRPGLRFELANIFNLHLELDRFQLNSNLFNCVVDKGTLDAIDNCLMDEAKVNRYFEEISSVLCLFGRYILITLAQDHIVNHIANYFLDERSSWIVSCYQMTSPDKKNSDSFSLPLFAFVMTKMKPSPVLPQLRLKALIDEQPCRPIHEDTKIRLMDWIKYLQTSCILSQTHIQSNRYCEFDIVHEKSGVAMFTCRVVVADGAKNSVDPTKRRPKAVFLVPLADAKKYTSDEAEQELLEKMGCVTCGLLAFTHPSLRFASLDVAKSFLSDGLVSSPLSAAVSKAPIYSTPDGYPDMYIIKERSPYAVISEVAKKRKPQHRLLVERLDTDIYRFISSELFSEGSAILLLTWISVARQLVNVLGLDEAKFVYYGVPPCTHKAITDFIRVNVHSQALKSFLRDFTRNIRYEDGSEEELAFMCYGPVESVSDEGLTEFLLTAKKSLIPQGICCILIRESYKKDASADIFDRIERLCEAPLQILLRQECDAASIFVIYKRKQKVSRAKFATRIRQIAVHISQTKSDIFDSMVLNGDNKDAFEKVNACLSDMRKVLEGQK